MLKPAVILYVLFVVLNGSAVDQSSSNLKAVSGDRRNGQREFREVMQTYINFRRKKC